MRSRRTLLVALSLLAATNAIVLVIRAFDVAATSRLLLFPAEGPVLYNIWKVLHAHPLYESPFKPPFPLTLYNFLFYESTARLFRLLGVSDGGMIVPGRFIAMGWTVCVIAAEYAAARRLFPSSRSSRALFALIAIVTWTGCGLPGWWMFAIRPDIPAAAFAAAAMACAAVAFSRDPRLPRALRRVSDPRLPCNPRHGDDPRLPRDPRQVSDPRHDDDPRHVSDPRLWLASASVLFFCAWSFKQSNTSILLATLCYVLLWRRSIVELLLVAGPFAAGAAATLAIGGPLYRENILQAPWLSPWVPDLPLHWYRPILLTHLLIWAMAAYGIRELLRPVTARGRIGAIGSIPARSVAVFGVDLTYPALATAIAFAQATVMLSRVGSALNHTFELNLAASVLTAGVLSGRDFTARASRTFVAAAVATIPMLMFDATLLSGREWGRVGTALQLKVWGDNLRMATPAALADREALERLYRSLPAPIYTEDELFALPWYSTRDGYPAVVLDRAFYDAAAAKGRIETGVDGLFRQRYFASAVLRDTSTLLPVAIASGYHPAGTQTPPDRPLEPLRILLRQP